MKGKIKKNEKKKDDKKEWKQPSNGFIGHNCYIPVELTFIVHVKINNAKGRY